MTNTFAVTWRHYGQDVVLTGRAVERWGGWCRVEWPGMAAIVDACMPGNAALRLRPGSDSIQIAARCGTADVHLLARAVQDIGHDRVALHFPAGQAAIVPCVDAPAPAA